jgi:catechol 2,3-dioxygenase-like lactoylglutathione lyase family enzyme
MICVKEYNHVALVVRDLEKCKWFYGALLGLTSLPRPPFNFPGQWFQVGPNAALHLMVSDETIPTTMRHIALEVEDFQETLRDLKASAIEISEGPGKRVDGSDYLFCHDPDKNLVEITHHEGV